jgi:hypothetical protein
MLVLRSLTQKTHFPVQEIKLATIPRELSEAFFSETMPALRHLYITRQQHMTAAMEEQLVGFLRVHPAIETLQLTLVTPGRWSTSVVPPYPLLPNIRHLLDAPGPLMVRFPRLLWFIY